jgi:hypothetical protein
MFGGALAYTIKVKPRSEGERERAPLRVAAKRQEMEAVTCRASDTDE